MTNLQKQLILCYYECLDPKDLDGLWGPKSAAATGKLQKLLGIPDDGVWGNQTEEAIREIFYKGTDRLSAPAEEKNLTGTFWDHIRYWSREEFRCRCAEYNKEPLCNGFPVEPDQTLVELVDDLRHQLGAPGHRSSGIRCPQHNANEGGVSNSKHMSGKALDFFVEGVSGQKLLAAAQADPRTSYAYIINGQYVHVDVD